MVALANTSCSTQDQADHQIAAEPDEVEHKQTLVNDAVDEAAFLEGVRDAYQGPVTVGRDGTMVSLPSASKEIARRELR